MEPRRLVGTLHKFFPIFLAVSAAHAQDDAAAAVMAKALRDPVEFAYATRPGNQLQQRHYLQLERIKRAAL